jgi:hypothetical protein
MQYVYSMQNMSFGEDGGLTEACQIKHPTEPHLCFMSPHMADVIETPLFMFNSQYDAWQLGNEFQATFGVNQTQQQEGVIQYGADFITQLMAAGIGANGSKHGGVITSCICHRYSIHYARYALTMHSLCTALTTHCTHYTLQLHSLHTAPTTHYTLHPLHTTHCLCHSCRWGSFVVDGKTSSQWYADW